MKEDGIRRRAMCSVCLEVKDRIKVVKSVTVHNSSLNSNEVPHTGSLQMLSIFFAITGWLREDQSNISGYLGSH